MNTEQSKAYTSKFEIPLWVRIAKSEKGKKYQLNLNYYRNWHFTQSNSIKQKFCENMGCFLEGMKYSTPISLKFKLFPGSKRKSDRANVLSIIEKFFSDALVYYNCIADDSDEYIESSFYCSGEVDSLNPRVEVEIIEREKWNTIPGFVDYMISNLGRVKSLKNGKEMILNDGLTRGYHRVILCRDGKTFNANVARMVASAFIPNPENKPAVNHIDCDKNNNRVENLEWVTHKENTQHAMNVGNLGRKGRRYHSKKDL